jgi:hypothetical protein
LLSWSSPRPVYATTETRIINERMIAAHSPPIIHSAFFKEADNPKLRVSSWLAIG